MYVCVEVTRSFSLPPGFLYMVKHAALPGTRSFVLKDHCPLSKSRACMCVRTQKYKCVICLSLQYFFCVWGGAGVSSYLPDICWLHGELASVSS